VINPLSVALEGYLNDPLAIVTSGYILTAEVGVPVGGGGSGHKSKRTITGKSVADLQAQLKDDEEIITIILAAIQQGII